MFGPGWQSFKTRQRPAPGEETFKPKLTHKQGPDTPVPNRFRSVRLVRRKRRPSMGRTPVLIRLAVVAAILGFVLVAWQVLFSTGGVPGPY